MRIWRHTAEKKAADLVESTISLVDKFVSPKSYYVEAFAQSCKFRHPVYDFFYALLARRTGAILFTVDKKLVELCDKMGVNVIREIDF